MATPTLGNTPSTIDDAESATGWTLLTTLDTDLVKENANSVSGIMRIDLAEGYYNIITDGGSALNLANQHVRCWINFSTVAFLDTEANGGMEFSMYDGTTTEYRTAFGSDTYSGGWKNYVVDANLFTTLTLSSVQQWGWRFNRTAAPANKINCWVDYMRYGDGYYATGGTSGDEIDLSGMFAQDFASGYGILDLVEGVYFAFGDLQIGNSTTTTWFEMLGEVLVFTDQDVATGLYALRGEGSGCRVNIADSVIRSAGTGANTRFAFDMNDANLLSCSVTGSFLTRAAACDFKSGQTITGNVFDDCLQITPAGADMTGCTVKNYEGTAGTAALVYNVNADPDGEMDDMTFTKGTAATAAIELGSNCPSSITLRGWTTSGYNASNGQNDSTIYNNSGKSITVNIVEGSGNFTYRNGAGASTVVNSAVTLTVTAKDLDNVVVENARVLLEAAPGGAAPSDASVSITSSGSTATVSHSSHGMSNGDWVAIRGANQQEYNGVNQISNVSANAYDYTITGTPASPATGTITSTQVYINELTNASGIASEPMNFGATQPVRGTCRKSSPSDNPKYIAGRIVGDITSIGFTTTVIMVEDE